MDQRRKTRTIFWVCDLLLLVLLVYSNHFRNTFHFDDGHTVVQNPYIRELRNIPRFFTDARTFSVLPQNRAWRPLVSTSLAIDYRIGGGLNPISFHASTFLWFLLQLVLMYALFRRICDMSLPDPRNRWVALFAVAWFGLHPAIAETINYIIQRGDVYSTLGVIAALWVYSARPGWRKYGLYLLPFAAGVLSKPPALIFPAILFVYIWLFEEDAGPGRLMRTVRRCVPALVAAAALGILSAAMVPKEFKLVVISPSAYRITQPLVALRFFRTLFIPDGLSLDTDHEAVASIWQGGAWAGFIFVALAMAAAIVCSRHRQWRPAAFGLWWFFLAFLPAAMLPVPEVQNDHRMFFPFAGLVLAVCWPIAMWIYRRPAGSKGFAFGVAAVCTLELAFCALSTRQRNVVWHSEESLWYDAMIKSPGNAKNMKGYADCLIRRGDLRRGLDYLNQAKRRLPNFALLELDLGIANGELGRQDEAERHFRRGILLDPTDAAGHTFYARWLEKQGQWPETLDQLRIALNLNPDYMDTYYVTMQAYAKRDLWPATAKAAQYVLGRFPSDPDAKAYLVMAAFETTGLSSADAFIRSLQTPDNLLNLSALYFQVGKFERSIAAATEAIKLRPDYPEAYNNIATAYRELGEWDLAIQASRQALRLKPDFDLARQNLSRSEQQRKTVITQ